MSTEPPAPAGAILGCFAPLFPVRDLQAAIAHYERLGFAIQPFDDGAEYAFASRDRAILHLSLTPDHDPLTGAACVYVEVSDVDALSREWRAAGAGGKTSNAEDKEYRIREAVHIDLDNNMIRFGSPLEQK